MKKKHTPLKLKVERYYSLHSWAFTVPTFEPNLLSIGVAVSEKSTCGRQTDIDHCSQRS